MSDDRYSFLPGEIAYACSEWDTTMDYPYESCTVPIQYQKDGQTQDGRPKCMWIDGAEGPGKTGDATPWQGFQVHLPDFKPDGSRFKSWEKNPYHMCGSRTRFGAYKHLSMYSKWHRAPILE